MHNCPRCGAPIETAGDLCCPHCGAPFDNPRAAEDRPADLGEHEADVAVDPGTYDVVDDAPRPRTAPAPSISPTGIACIRCGYDVSGTALGSTCPECGTPVLDSVPKPSPRVVGPDGVERGVLPTSSVAGWALGVGIASILCCGPLGIVAILLGAQARRDIANGSVDPSRRGVATAGIVLGILGLAILAFQFLEWMR